MQLRTAGKLSLTSSRIGDGPAVKPRRIGRTERLSASASSKQTESCAFAPRSLRSSRLQELLDHRSHNRAQKIAVFGHHRFDLTGRPVTILSGHGSIFSWLLVAPNCLP
jgi:hypothetical protein